MLNFYLHWTRLKDATDARDKIYALLGLIDEFRNPVNLLSDYGRATTHVYTETTPQIIHYQRNLLAILNHEERDSFPDFQAGPRAGLDCLAVPII